MEYIRFVFLGLLAVATAIHLIDSWHDDAKKRRRTKPFLLVFILLYYIFSADKISWILVCALSTSWIGDLLLMGKGNKWFTLGGISFMLSHFSFIAVYLVNIIKQPLDGVIWWIVIPMTVIYFTIALFIVHALKPTTPKSMLVPMYIYLLSNSSMNIFSLIQLMVFRTPGAIVAYIGAVLFYISDCTLYLVRYYKNENLIFKRHFTVMLTYVLAELFIAQGVLMIS